MKKFLKLLKKDFLEFTVLLLYFIVFFSAFIDLLIYNFFPIPLFINLIIVFLIGIIIVAWIYTLIATYKVWNGGISPYTGEKWVCFDTDSALGRMYKDDKENIIIVSWSFDIIDNEINNKNIN